MAISSALARGPRCTLVNVATAERMDCLFNPTEFSEKLTVNWNRLVVPGMSHQVLQFQSSGNRQLPMEFYLDRTFATEQPGIPEILEFRAFLRALTVPVKGTRTVAATAPPRVLVLWPGVLAMECVVGSVDFAYKRFSAEGVLLVYTAQVTFEEMSDVRVTSEELRGEVY